MECGFEREMLAIQMLGYLQGLVVIIIVNNKSELLENTSERVRPWTEDKTLDALYGGHLKKRQILFDAAKCFFKFGCL